MNAPACASAGPTSETLREVEAALARNAARHDAERSFPADSIAVLDQAGWLRNEHAECGSVEATRRLARRLTAAGRGDLAVGRLFEGHLNALGLIALYGSPAQRDAAAADARAGRLHGVWNTERQPGMRLTRSAAGWVVRGRKDFASGGTHAEIAVLTARDDTGATRLLRIATGQGAASYASWQAMGMRASMSGTFSLPETPVDSAALIGAPGDYYREPAFSCGAWRVLAVQLGGLEALGGAMRAQLVASGRAADAQQAARLGEVAAACETARLWTMRAALIAEGRKPVAMRIAYVGLARHAVEQAAAVVLDRAARSIGIAAFLQPNPIERISRDLMVYLRQAAPDGVMRRSAGYVAETTKAWPELWH